MLAAGWWAIGGTKEGSAIRNKVQFVHTGLSLHTVSKFEGATGVLRGLGVPCSKISTEAEGPGSEAFPIDVTMRGRSD